MNQSPREPGLQETGIQIELEEESADDPDFVVDREARESGSLQTALADKINYNDGPKAGIIDRYFNRTQHRLPIEFLAESLSLLSHGWIAIKDYEDYLHKQSTYLVTRSTRLLHGLIFREVLDKDQEDLLYTVYAAHEHELATARRMVIKVSEDVNPISGLPDVEFMKTTPESALRYIGLLDEDETG